MSTKKQATPKRLTAAQQCKRLGWVNLSVKANMQAMRDEDREGFTKLGMFHARGPVSPKTAKMVLDAYTAGCADDEAEFARIEAADAALAGLKS